MRGGMSRSRLWVFLGMGNARNVPLGFFVRVWGRDASLSPARHIRRNPTGYPWRGAPQQSPLPFHRLTQPSRCARDESSRTRERSIECRVTTALRADLETKVRKNLDTTASDATPNPRSGAGHALSAIYPVGVTHPSPDPDPQGSCSGRRPHCPKRRRLPPGAGIEDSRSGLTCVTPPG